MTGYHLITTDNWFYAPDGMKYRAAWGHVKVVEDSVLGIKTNRNSSNWYAFVGSEEKGILVAGCQIHYAVKCEEEPNTKKVKDIAYSDSGSNEYERLSEIYIAE